MRKIAGLLILLTGLGGCATLDTTQNPFDHKHPPEQSILTLFRNTPVAIPIAVAQALHDVLP